MVLNIELIVHFYNKSGGHGTNTDCLCLTFSNLMPSILTNNINDNVDYHNLFLSREKY